MRNQFLRNSMSPPLYSSEPLWKRHTEADINTWEAAKLIQTTWTFHQSISTVKECLFLTYLFGLVLSKARDFVNSRFLCVCVKRIPVENAERYPRSSYMSILQIIRTKLISLYNYKIKGIVGLSTILIRNVILATTGLSLRRTWKYYHFHSLLITEGTSLVL